MLRQCCLCATASSLWNCSRHLQHTNEKNYEPCCQTDGANTISDRLPVSCSDSPRFNQPRFATSDSCHFCTMTAGHPPQVRRRLRQLQANVEFVPSESCREAGLVSSQRTGKMKSRRSHWAEPSPSHTGADEQCTTQTPSFY